MLLIVHNIKKNLDMRIDMKHSNISKMIKYYIETLSKRIC